MKTKIIYGLLVVCIGFCLSELALTDTTFADSINLTVDSSTVELDLASSNQEGRFGESEAMNFSVMTDNQSGYTLTVLTTDGSSLTHANDPNAAIFSIDSATSRDVFSAAENTSFNNKWGYKPSKLNGAANTNFLPAPSTESDIIDTTWVPNSAANEYSISIGARINSDTPSGIYSNSIVITAVPNGPVLSVTYDGNGLYFGNDASNTTNTVIYDANSSTTGGVTTYTKTVLTGEFETPGYDGITYKFRGWSEDPDAISGTYVDEADIIANLPMVNGDPAVTLYAIWGRIYTLQYDGNEADNENGMGSTNAQTGLKTVYHSNVARGDTFDLFASNFKRDGYGFIGWSLDADAWEHLSDNDATNDPIIYGPNETIVAPAYQSDIMMLKAVWVPAETNGDDRVMLQNWEGCDSLTPTLYDSTTGKLTIGANSITALTDNRDNQVYAVARLADENCWVIENLRLDNTAELSATNTNIDISNSSLPLTNIYNSDPTLATTSNYLSRSSSGNAFNDQSYGWCMQYQENCLNQSRLNTSNITSDTIPSKIQNVTTPNAHENFGPAYSYGNYYNWYSVTAGYGVYSTTSTLPTTGDICPIGWHLPYGSNGDTSPDLGGTSGGFAYLDSAIGGDGNAASTATASNNWRVFPNNIVYSGYLNNGSTNNLGGFSAYWSSSAYGNNYSYYLKLTESYVGSGTDTFGKYIGVSARCVMNVGAH